MNAPFRICILGTGKIAVGSHLPAALAVPNTAVTALVDACLDRAEETARKFKLQARTATKIADVMDEIDAAVICTPNHTHCELAVECMRAGVHTLIEKPMTTTLRDAEAIVQAQQQSGTTVAVGYCRRFSNNMRLMKELLDEHHFGHPRRFTWQFGTIGGWSPYSAYNLDRQAAGGGVLIGTGSHFLDSLLWWFGYPDAFEYQDDSFGGPEANALATFRFNSGGQPFAGTTRFSKAVVLAPGFAMETDRGTVILREGEDAPIIFRAKEHPRLEYIVPRRENHTPLAGDPFVLQMADFVEACREGRAPMVSSKAGVESVRLLEALYACRTPLDLDFYASHRRETAL